MTLALEETHALISELELAKDRLNAALESISEGFVLYDADDRLIIINEAHKKIYKRMQALLVPGRRFEDILRGGVECGQYRIDEGCREDWIEKRLARHRTFKEPFERQLSDGRWVLIDERRTSDGGMVGIHTDITALKNAEQGLRDNEKFLRLIADNLPNLVAYCDLDGRVTFANRTGQRWYNRPQREIIGRTGEEILGSQAFAGFKRYRDLVRRGAEQHFDTSATYPDSVTRDVQAAYIPDWSGNGQLRGYVVMIADITERLSTHRELREREEYISAVAGNVADAIIAIDEDGQIESFNVSAERSFGYSAEEVIGRNVSLLLPEAYHDQHREKLSTYSTSGNSSIIGVGPRELTGRHKDGSEFPLELAIAEASVGGRRIFVGAARDISVRKQAELDIRDSEERFRVAFETAPHGIALVGLDGRILKANRALSDIVGYSQEELLELKFHTITHPDDLDANLDLIEQVLDGKTPGYQLEKRYVRKDGNIVPVLLSASLVRDADGSPLHFVSQILDLTELKAIQDQLLQAQKMETVGQLTGGIAHDFNNLLAVILGNSQLIARNVKTDEKLSKRAAAISESAKRGAELVQHLLAFSRKQTLDSMAVEVDALIEGMLDLLQRSLTEMVEIKILFDDGLQRAFVDPGQLENAILNLAINARDAMPDGGTLTLKTRNVAIDKNEADRKNKILPGHYVEISVSDTGTGISHKNIHRIFEPFYTTKEIGKGTGLGLSMVHGFVNQSGGHVEVDSRKGRGTTFRLYLPAADEVSEIRVSATNMDADSPLGNETILVVEDEASVREITVSLLQDLGYRVVEAKDGVDALAVLGKQPDVDLLFTDIIMPGGITGIALAEKVRERWPTIKILYTSGYNETALAQDEATDVAHNTLLKPYDDIELARRIRSALDT